MFLARLFLASIPLLGRLAHGSPHHITRADNESSIRWSECPKEILAYATLPMQCSTLKVPLDYTNAESSEKLDIAVYRVEAAVPVEQRKGSIIFNCGGPGSPCGPDLGAYAQRMQAATGGYHDLITFDPRGTKGSPIRFMCYDDPVSLAAAPPFIAGYSHEFALGQDWSASIVLSEDCAKKQNETGSLIGTAFVARDMMQIVDALKEDGLLRFWGVSYGTLLGATTVAMFPDRVDKIILDGVVNPFEYYHNQEIELFTDADAAFSGFCRGCVENPTACPLAQNMTAAELEESLYGLLDILKAFPIPNPNRHLPNQVPEWTYTSVKGNIYSRLYFPQTWPALAKEIEAIITTILTEDSTRSRWPELAQRLNAFIDILKAEGTFSSEQARGLYSRADNQTEIIKAALPDHSLAGIKCSDMFIDSASLHNMLPTLKARMKKSRIGGDASIQVPMTCANWKFKAKERYSGDFKVRTKTPVLVIGNTYDPVTPLASAKNVSETFEGSVLLHQDSYGHDSLPQASLCTAKAIRAYFLRGELPPVGTKCSTEVQLFAKNDGWEDVIKQLKSEPLSP